MRTVQRSTVSLIVASLALAFVASCATDPGDEEDPGETTSMTEQELSSNQHAAFNYFVARGLTKRQSAGIVGNLIQESSVNPRAIQFGGGPGRGIAQWSVGGRWNTTHHDNVAWYASAHSESRWSLHTQLAFTWYELHNVGGYGLSAIRRSTTIRGATIAFERDFEKCGQCDEAKRISYARQVYNAFAGAARLSTEDEVDETEAAGALQDEFDDGPAAE
jgi:hypothetical protein